MRKKIIIFGRSPFINNIDFSKIDNKKYAICVINYPHPNCKNFDYLVSADEKVRYEQPTKWEWVSRYTGWNFKYHQKGQDIILKENEISWRHFSSGIAVSFAILRGYEEIYLAGIDLNGNRVFEHFDGTTTKNKLSEQVCMEEKSFIVFMCWINNVKLYTLNKNNDWLEYKDIGILK